MSLLPGVDLSVVPLPFLQAYPFPAFVVHTPLPAPVRPKLVSNDTDVTIMDWRHEDVSPFSESIPALSLNDGASRSSGRSSASSTPVPGPSAPKSRMIWSNDKWVKSHYGAGLNDLEHDFEFQSWVKNDFSSSLYSQDKDNLFECNIQQSMTKLLLTNTLLTRTDTYTLSIVTSIIPSEPVNVHRPAPSEASDHRGSVDTVTSSAPLDPSPGVEAPGFLLGRKRPGTRSSTHSSARASSRLDPGSPGPDRGLMFHNKMLTNTSDCWALVNHIDWSKTSLGPRSAWPPEYESMLGICFQSPSQDSLWLGEDLVMIYNLPYHKLVKGPQAFGKPGREVWSSLWEYLGPITQKALSGTPTYVENDLLLYGQGTQGVEEHYHSWRYVPITSRSGRVLGLFNQSIETTKQVLAERRLNTVRDLSEQLLVIRSVKEYYDSVASILEENSRDSPFTLLYSAHQTATSANTASVTVQLEATVGVPEEDASAPDQLHFTIPLKTRSSYGTSAAGLSSPTLSAISALSSGSGRQMQYSDAQNMWPIHKALTTRQCVLVSDCRELIKRYEIRQWDELPTSAIVVPICGDSGTDIPEAVMIMGLNIRCSYDADYDAWVNVLRAHLASSLAAVKSQEQEERLRDDVLRMERAKSAWIQGAAHDLRGPLALISAPIDDLLDASPTDVQKRYLTTAKRSVDRLLRLVNSLMEFSQLETGNVTGRFVPTDLGAFVTDLAQLFRPAIEKRGIELVIDAQPSAVLTFLDPNLFETVVTNLITNALKSTEHGQITVRVRYEQDAELSVTDTGVGLSPEELSTMGEWFHRSSTVSPRGHDNSSLGIAISREILRLHDGELVIASEQGRGSTFTAKVPLTTRSAALDSPDGHPGLGYGSQMAKDAMRWMQESTETDDMSEVDGRSTISSSAKISDGLLFTKEDRLLVVDENADLRQYIRSMFAPFCTVLEASNGQDAYNMAIANPPNLILSDVVMPKMDGFDLLQAIRRHPKTKIVPLIMLTAVSNDEARVNSLILGAEDFLAKPFKPKELLARVHLHMQVGKKRAKLEELYAQREAEIQLLSDFCPSAILRADMTGVITYANQAWRDLAGMTAETDPNSWPDAVDGPNLAYLSPKWAGFLSSDEPELTMTWTWLTGKRTRGQFIKLDQRLPGSVGILGCVTDITLEESRLREAEERRLEAEESKRQQELLVDLTSHEIRTPVSAILQCSSLVKENLVALTEQLKWTGATGFIPTAELLQDLAEDIEALESIYQCGLVQERIAGDVLSLARIQLDMLSLHDVETDLRKEAKKVVSVFTSEAKMKQIELKLEFGHTLGLAKVSSVKTDHVRLGQVVTNLVSNAIRFTATSSTRCITVTYDVSFAPPAEGTCALPSSIALPETLPAPEDTPLWLFVGVRDTGPGLGPKELAKLFQRFSQGNKMIHTQYGGSGLGLFICRKITELLGGRIEVQSQLGEGSVFRFFIKTSTTAGKLQIDLPAITQSDTLPNALESPALSIISGRSTPSRPSSAMSSTSSTSALAPSTATTPTPPGGAIGGAAVASAEDTKRLHILIVEDNIINQTVLKRQIVKAGLTCDVANNGLEALQLIREADRSSKRGGVGRKQPYDTILMDLEMPVMDGLTAVREIRSAEKNGTLARQMVIALTGNARQAQIDTAMEAGMDDVVIKPYVLNNLLKKIRDITAKRVISDSQEEQWA